jgi:small subunit ribosomal protein S20
MPIIKSAMKRVRQAAKRRSNNLQVKRAIHRDIRAFQDALEAGDAAATTQALRTAISEIDRAVKKGTIHRNTAARRKSQLSKAAFATVGAGDKAPAAKAGPAAKPKAKPKATRKSSTK